MLVEIRSRPQHLAKPEADQAIHYRSLSTMLNIKLLRIMEVVPDAFQLLRHVITPTKTVTLLPIKAQLNHESASQSRGFPFQ
jgi:hypothetical protein